jgi:hypothetical protein
MKYQVLLAEDSKAIQQMYRNKLILKQFAGCQRCQVNQ